MKSFIDWEAPPRYQPVSSGRKNQYNPAALREVRKREPAGELRVKGDRKQIFAGLRIMGLTPGVIHFNDSWAAGWRGWDGRW